MLEESAELGRGQIYVWLQRGAAVLLMAATMWGLSFALSPAVSDANDGDEIIVRAQGSTGTEQMVLRVNGAEAARWTVSSAERSYRFAVPDRLEINAVEIALVNDNGPRDLRVDHVDVGGTVLQSEASTTRSTGTWVSGQGGCRSRPSVSETLHCNGSFNYNVPAGTILGDDTNPTTGAREIAVRAIGIAGTEQLEVRVDGDVVLSTTVGTNWNIYRASVEAGVSVETVEVHFLNDGGSRRDMRVDYMEIDGQRFESEAATTRSRGTWSGGSCGERNSVSEWLHCTGWFRYDVSETTPVPATPVPPTPVAPTPVPPTPVAPTPVPSTPTPVPSTPTPTPTPVPPSTSDLLIRARGTSGTENMRLTLDGEAVASWTVTQDWAIYRHVGIGDADLVEVQFTNDGGNRRDMRVDYIEVDGERLQAEASSTRATGSYLRGVGCAARASTSEWLYCNGSFQFSLSGQPLNGPVTQPTPTPTATPPAPGATPTPTPTPTAPAPAPTPTPSGPSGNNRYSIAQVIDGTIGAGDGSNPNEEAPMGRHDAPLYLPQGWNWSQGPSRNSVWGNLGTGGSRFVEWRCAVIPEFGHRPPVDFRINVSQGAYYQFANGSWNKAFDVDLTGGNHGGYLAQAGRLNTDPFSSGGHGQIQWRREADGSFSAPWNSNALMMHFWAGRRQSPAPGQTAEFLTSEVRLQQPDGRNVDLSRVNVLFQCGVDYYNTTGGQGTKVPGPGIAKYHRVTTEAKAGLWVTLPGNAPAASVADFDRWLRQNPPPNVGG